MTVYNDICYILYCNYYEVSKLSPNKVIGILDKFKTGYFQNVEKFHLQIYTYIIVY